MAVIAAGLAVFWCGTARTRDIGPAWMPGKSLTYAVTTRAEGINTPTALFSSQSVAGQRYTIGVDGRLRATVLHADEHGATVAWTFEAPHVAFAQDDRPNAALGSAMERDLAETYVTQSDADGAITAFSADPRASTLGAGYMRGIASTLEIVRPSETRTFGRSWTATEPDIDGTRSSVYALAFWLDSPLVVPTARFVRTSTIGTPRGDEPYLVAPRVRAKTYDQGLLREDGILAHVVATERRGVRIGDRRIASSQATTIATLVAIAPAPDDGISADLERRIARAGSLHAERSASELEAAAFRQEANATTFDVVMHRLRASAGDPSHVGDLARALAAQFFVHPETTARVAPVLESSNDASAVFSAVALGFAYAGTPEAQQVLAGAMLARASDPTSEVLAASLARTVRPDAASIAALETLARKNSARTSSVELSLGTAASMLARSDPAAAARIAGRLAAALRRSRDSKTERTLLLALGNARNAGTLPAILPYARVSEAAVRAASAAALRGIRSPAAGRTLRSLLRDPDDGVRLYTAKAFVDRELDDADFDAVVRAARGDTNRDVRIAAIDAIGAASEDHPGARVVLEDLGAHDADANIRALATTDLRHLDSVAAADRM